MGPAPPHRKREAVNAGKQDQCYQAQGAAEPFIPAAAEAAARATAPAEC